MQTKPNQIEVENWTKPNLNRIERWSELVETKL